VHARTQGDTKGARLTMRGNGRLFSTLVPSAHERPGNKAMPLTEACGPFHSKLPHTFPLLSHSRENGAPTPWEV
jgi:hypothetical protein